MEASERISPLIPIAVRGGRVRNSKPVVGVTFACGGQFRHATTIEYRHFVN
jgi:hypothetical protein